MLVSDLLLLLEIEQEPIVLEMSVLHHHQPRLPLHQAWLGVQGWVEYSRAGCLNYGPQGEGLILEVAAFLDPWQFNANTI